jgi:hypothetical protein
MAKRPCSEPGCPTLTTTTRCPTHTRQRDKARGTRQQRGYDAAHTREAQAWRDRIRRGERVTCWRCAEPITDAADCHLGHDDVDRTITRGPEHATCNLRAAGRNSPMS